MLIDEDSPLRRLPANLNPKQAQFCDAVRFTAEMADHAYIDLLGHLLALLPTDSNNVRLSATAPFLFAWSIVDSAHRLQGLVENFPNLAGKKQSLEFRRFLEKAEGVETLRNAVQHMDSEIHKSHDAGKAVWGTLSWLRPAPQGVVYTCLLVSGAMMPGGKHTPINPAGVSIKEPLEQVTLTVGDVAVNLSEVMDALGNLVYAIEGCLAEAFEASPKRAGSDMFIALAMVPGPNDTMVPLKAAPPGEE